MGTDLEIIAEIHPQHGGSMPMIREITRAAKLAGANAVKVQLYDSQRLLGPDWEYLELSEENLAIIRRWCEQDSIGLSASVFDAERLEWCLKLGITDLKIASITLRDDRELCDQIVTKASRVTISLGYWSGQKLPYPPSERIRYLYCKSLYPAFFEDISDFPDRFSSEEIAGYSDHTLGISLPLLAIARGASIIEKHMTLDKTQGKKTEKAHVCSMTPEELCVMRDVGGEMYRTLRAIELPRHSR